MQRSNRIAAIAAAIAFTTGAARAVEYPLNQLIASGAPITHGDMTFDNFSFDGNIDSTSLKVIPSNNAGDYFLTFLGPVSVADGGAIFYLTYTVATLSGLPITKIDQAFSLLKTGAGGIIGIEEAVATASNGYIGISKLNSGDTSDSGAGIESGDNLDIDPGASELLVTTEVFIYSFPEGSIGFHAIGQSFHQSSPSFPSNSGVPDGGATALLLGGMLSALCFFRSAGLPK